MNKRVNPNSNLPCQKIDTNVCLDNLSCVSEQTISNVSLELGDWLSYCGQQSTVANYHIK